MDPFDQGKTYFKLILLLQDLKKPNKEAQALMDRIYKALKQLDNKEIVRDIYFFLESGDFLPQRGEEIFKSIRFIGEALND